MTPPVRHNDATPPGALNPAISRPPPKLAHQTACHCGDRKMLAVGESRNAESHSPPASSNEGMG